MDKMGSAMEKTAIVIGASGLVGQALVNELVDSPAYTRIHCITRRPLTLRHDKIHNTVIDFEQLEHSADQFRGDCLFSCLGTTRKQVGSVAAQRRIDLDYQFHAAQLAAQQGVDHYVLVSAMGANPRSRSAYMQMKGELETRVATLGFARMSIFQPSLLTGDRDHKRPAEDLSAPLLSGLCKLPGLRKYRPIAATELARAMLQCSLREGAAIEHYPLDRCFP